MENCCTYVADRKPHKQHMFKCVTCSEEEDIVCCEECAKVCHKEHVLVDLGIVENGQCDCGQFCCKEACKLQKEKGVCTNEIFRECYHRQHIWGCRTCGILEPNCMCTVCKDKCHKGHDIIDFGICDRANCDCAMFNNCPCGTADGQKVSSMMYHFPEGNLSFLDKSFTQQLLELVSVSSR